MTATLEAHRAHKRERRRSEAADAILGKVGAAGSAGCFITNAATLRVADALADDGLVLATYRVWSRKQVRGEPVIEHRKCFVLTDRGRARLAELQR